MKKFKVAGHSAWMVSTKAKTGWCDVWVTTSAGKNRTKEIALTLISRSSLEIDIELHEKIRDSYENVDFDHETQTFTHTPIEGGTKRQEHFTLWDKDVLAYRGILSRLKLNREAIVPLGPSRDTYYTNSQYIDRREALRMITEVLWRQGYSSVKLKIQKPTDIITEVF